MVTKAAFVAVVSVTAVAGVAGGVALHHVLPAYPVVRGLSIGERVVPDDVSAAAWLEARRDALKARVVRFHLDDAELTSTLGEAGVEIDVAATLAQAEKVGHEGPLLRQVREARRARRGAVDVPLVWKLSDETARALFERLAASIYRVPIDARVDLARREKVPERPGRMLDVDAAIAALRAGTHDEEEIIELTARRIEAKVTVEDLVRVDVTRVVAAYETTFSTRGSGAGRAVNIAHAASKIDGTVLAPGESFSFNAHVGPRTRKNGFTMAPEILGDEMVPGYGGGTCQVSSTLYAAALFGAIEADERQSHSRPSSYIGMGLDAMVSYPEADLKLRNTLPYPIMVHAYLPAPTVIRVEILGGDPVATVDYGTHVEHTDDYVRRLYVKPDVAPGKAIRKQKGSCGYDVMSFVTVRYHDGRVAERRYTSEYKPAPEIFWLPPEYDRSALPEASEHVKAVEERVEGDAIASAQTDSM